MDQTLKIRPEHLNRLACIYIRQSTMRQVRENTVSTELQYGLVERAIALGWPRERICVYDGDLGVSGSIPAARKDFAHLVAEVGLGRVGLVLSFDVTRMARNNTDWYKLLDLCSICDTLIADSDGVYCPALYNDRLLLGLKGTMSEAEGHFRRLRLQGGIEKLAMEGALRKRLPVGLDYDNAGQVRLAMDESVRHAIETVFRKFEQLGSAHQVYRYLQSEGFLLPARRNDEQHARWLQPRYYAVIGILTNPRYAGAYVYGRSRRHRTVDESGRIHLRVEQLPRSQWRVVLQNQHPGYISWEQYEANLKRLLDNGFDLSGDGASKVIREGSALLHGLARCGICGRRMRPTYATKGKGDPVRYVCDRSSRDHGYEGICQSVGGRRIHRAVVEAFLEALSPASMQVTLAALEQMDATEDAMLIQLRQRREHAQYEAERARRQYEFVEPENRLVARTLESEWNNRLLELTDMDRQITEHHNRPQTPPLTPEERKRLMELGLDLGGIWDAPTTTPQERKQLLRAVFNEVILKVDRSVPCAKITLLWQGGATSELDVQLQRSGHHSSCIDDSIIEDVRKMAAVMTDAQIAATLVRRAIRTPKGLPYNAVRVQELRKRHDIPEYQPTPSDDNEPTYTAQEAGEKLGVSGFTVLRWLREGFLVGEQVAPRAPWRIKLGAVARLKVADRAPKGWLPPKAAAKALGVSRRTVLLWVHSGKLEAVMAGRGRRSGLRINVTSGTCSTQPPLFDQLPD